VLFQYAIILNPTVDEAKAGVQPRLLKDITTKIAVNQQAAMMSAAREIPAEYEDELDRVEVAIKPF
jgi:hypothetical protein